MRKIFGVLTLAVLLMLSTVLAGCSSPNAKADSTNGKVVVNFWTFWGSQTRRPVIEKIVNDFNKSQDKIIVKHTFIPFGDIWTKNLAAVAAGNPADVVINDINSVSQRAANNQATDLSPYINADFKNQFYPNLWNTVLYQGKPYAVPFNTDTRLLFYNKDAFKQAGLDPNKPPKTWKELEEDAKKLDIKQGGQYARLGYYPLFGSFGAPSWLKNADNGVGYIQNGQLKIDTPNKEKALQWLSDWQNRYGAKTIQNYQAEFSNGQANPFIAGKVAMYTDVATFYTQIRDSGTKMNFGVAPIPAFDDNSKPWDDGGGFVAEVPKGAKHPKEAMEFIKYLTGETAQKYWAEKNYDNVANKAAAQDATKDLAGDAKMVYSEAVNVLPYTTLSPTPLNYPDYQNRINPLIDAALQGKMSPKAALSKAQNDVEKMKK